MTSEHEYLKRLKKKWVRKGCVYLIRSHFGNLGINISLKLTAATKLVCVSHETVRVKWP